ncbi:MAG: hypothetical protein WA252_02840 [Candidatus Sulfotelmatobacter sp.]
MKLLKSIAILSCLAFTCTVFTPAARADLWNQATELHFNQPVEVPGVVLPAGDYWFVLENNPADRNVVEIFNAQRSQLYATVNTIPTLCQRGPGRTEVVLADRPSQPDALWKWYYPGLQTGQQFLYPGHEEKHLRSDEKQVVLVPPISSAQPNMVG